MSKSAFKAGVRGGSGDGVTAGPTPIKNGVGFAPSLAANGSKAGNGLCPSTMQAIPTVSLPLKGEAGNGGGCSNKFGGCK